MTLANVRASKPSNILLPIIAGISLCFVGIEAPRAETGLDFIVADNDGYGIAECMKPGMECGHVMADAWCEAHGHGHASAFGSTDDVTGAIKVSAPKPFPLPANAVVIHCGD